MTIPLHSHMLCWHGGGFCRRQLDIYRERYTHIIHTYTHTHIHTQVHTHTYLHTYIHIYIHTYITNIHTYIHTYTHTHTCIHTYIQMSKSPQNIAHTAPAKAWHTMLHLTWCRTIDLACLLQGFGVGTCTHGLTESIKTLVSKVTRLSCMLVQMRRFLINPQVQ